MRMSSEWDEMTENFQNSNQIYLVECSLREREREREIELVCMWQSISFENIFLIAIGQLQHGKMGERIERF